MSGPSGRRSAPKPSAARTQRAQCPCGDGRAYSACCRPYHLRRADPPTAVALMRSRYSAAAKGLTSYLAHSWHPDQCPEDLGDQRAEWRGLEILATVDGGPDDPTGTVEFIAHWHQDGENGTLHELSRFERWNGRWVYTTGDLLGTP